MRDFFSAIGLGAWDAGVWVKDHPRTYAFALGVAVGWWWL